MLLLHELTLTGAPRVALDLFEHLGDVVDLRVVSLRAGPLEGMCRQLGSVQIPPEAPTSRANRSPRARLARAWQSMWHPFRDQLWWKSCSRALKAWAPDVIYINSVAALPIARRLQLSGAPVLLHVHELGSQLSIVMKEHATYLRELPQRYIAASVAVATALTDLCQVPPSKIAVIHEFIPTRKFEGLVIPPGSVTTAREERLVVGGAGSVEWRKGNELWLHMAVELLKLLGPSGVRFVWVGIDDGDRGWQFREMAHKLNIQQHVEFVPLTPEPLSHFTSFDVFCMTSWEDPCPIVVLEVMMLQKPVVCFRGGGGAPEEVGETGLVVEEFSPRDMAQAVARLAESPALRDQLGRAAQERVRQHFTTAVQVPKIQSEITSLSRS